jgi:uncharacterized protein YjiS (DUF1127 family)
MPWRLIDQSTSALRRRLILVLAVLTSLLAAAGTFAGVYAVIRIGQQQHDIKDAVAKIQQSRIVLSKQSCRQRNNERAITRSNLRQNLAQLTKISDGALATLGYTREQAEAQIHKQLRQVAPLDCKKLVKQVASNRTRVSKGGGSGSTGIPRPTRTTASKDETGPDSGSGAGGSETPSEPGTGRPHKPPGGGDSGPPSGPPPGGGGGGVVNPPSNPQPPTNPRPDPGGVVQTLVDGVGRVVERVVPGLP